MEPEWRPIGQTANQLILYHPPSHALQVLPHDQAQRRVSTTPTANPLLIDFDSASIPVVDLVRCPMCGHAFEHGSTLETSASPAVVTGENDYFQTLENVHVQSRPTTPITDYSIRSRLTTAEDSINSRTGADGYYVRYFREEKRLGVGAEGSVYLATHVIDGNELGRYAVKKVAVGQSKTYLVRMLEEVRLLESLRHPNIIPYHHAWIEEARFSSFGPPVVALHILMMFATAGNLDTFISTRSHDGYSGRAGGLESDSFREMSRADKVKALKKRRQSRASEWHQGNRAILLLDRDEIMKVFSDIASGLSFLHQNGVLHLDLKCSNVLLHWEEGALVPRAMIGDFGTSERMLRGLRDRTGHTGTLEYMAPETISTDARGHWRPSDSHADMWSLGMILHRLLFLHLPYHDVADLLRLHNEIASYPGFTASANQVDSCHRRRIPPEFLLLLSSLLHVIPEKRPSSEKVCIGLRAIANQISSESPNVAEFRKTKPSTDPSRAKDGDHFLALLPSEPPEPLADTDAATVEETWSNLRAPINLGRPLRLLAAVVFVVKVISLQPDISPVPVPLPLSLALYAVAVCDVLYNTEIELWLSAAAAGIHLLVLLAVTWHVT